MEGDGLRDGRVPGPAPHQARAAVHLVESYELDGPEVEHNAGAKAQRAAWEEHFTHIVRSQGLSKLTDHWVNVWAEHTQHIKLKNPLPQAFFKKLDEIFKEGREDKKAAELDKKVAKFVCEGGEGGGLCGPRQRGGGVHRRLPHALVGSVSRQFRYVFTLFDSRIIYN